MVDYPISQSDLENRFGSVNCCLDYLNKTRWPVGPLCPSCQSDQYLIIGHSFKCIKCHTPFSVLSGTTFHGTDIPIPDWFRIMWFVVSRKLAASSIEIHRSLNLAYPTIRKILHKLRRAMVHGEQERLSGAVEVDEVYLVGLSKNTKARTQIIDRKTLAMAVELNDSSSGSPISRVRLKLIETASAENLIDFVQESVQTGTHITTDQWAGYSKLETCGYTHVIKTMESNQRAMPYVHIVASLLKAWLSGSLSGFVRYNNLGNYLNEFAFRFNQRKTANPGKLFHSLVEHSLRTPPSVSEAVLKREPINNDATIEENPHSHDISEYLIEPW